MSGYRDTWTRNQPAAWGKVRCVHHGPAVSYRCLDADAVEVSVTHVFHVRRPCAAAPFRVIATATQKPDAAPEVTIVSDERLYRGEIVAIRRHVLAAVAEESEGLWTDAVHAVHRRRGPRMAKRAETGELSS
jgi:hypothetical protein